VSVLLQVHFAISLLVAFPSESRDSIVTKKGNVLGNKAPSQVFTITDKVLAPIQAASVLSALLVFVKLVKAILYYYIIKV